MKVSIIEVYYGYVNKIMSNQNERNSSNDMVIIFRVHGPNKSH